MNWGSSIALFYGCFMAGMIYLVVRSTQHKPDLVRQDYYQLDIDYQAHLEKKQRTADLEVPLKASVNRAAQAIELAFPKANPSGVAKFYRYNSESDAFTVKIQADETGKIQVPSSELAKGRWHIEVDWSAEGLDYFEEFDVFI